MTIQYNYSLVHLFRKVMVGNSIGDSGWRDGKGSVLFTTMSPVTLLMVYQGLANYILLHFATSAQQTYRWAMAEQTEMMGGMRD